VADELAETGERTVTLIDGDVARRFLTAGLGFTKADRDENVRRIGFVAAEAARHGGLALCCPIAPYAQARNAARALAKAAGAGFILVYVATPLDVCQDRDPKGLYAKARDGKIQNMTGVDDPYEIPTDADLVIDTSTLPVGEAASIVLEHLVVEGWLDRP
jgi:sulfate adenylyltransferase